MAKEQDAEPLPDFERQPETGFSETREGFLRFSNEDPYGLAEAHFMSEVERLQQAGELRRPSQITDEEELDDHFDDLSRLYRQTCREMGLPWPPPAVD